MYFAELKHIQKYFIVTETMWFFSQQHVQKLLLSKLGPE